LSRRITSSTASVVPTATRSWSGTPVVDERCYCSPCG
jgi:hypothetical protein